MRHFCKSAITAILAALLSGCFESEQPLISAQNADYPFERDFHYVFYEWNKDAKNWEPSETGTVKRDGDHYVQLPDVGNDSGDPFLLKAIGDNFYIAQQPSKSSHIYDLVRINGNIIYQYGMSCTDADKRFAQQKLIDSIKTDSNGGNTCMVSSLDKLGRVFRAIADERPQPQGMFGVDR
jgi:hypothetical protein